LTVGADNSVIDELDGTPGAGMAGAAVGVEPSKRNVSINIYRGFRYAPNEKKSTAGAAATVGRTSLAFPFAIEGGRKRPFTVDFSSPAGREVVLGALEKLSAGPPPPPSTRFGSAGARVAFLGAGKAANNDDDPAPFVPPLSDGVVRGFLAALSSDSPSSS
jgi:hypothetical protein